LGLIRGGLPAGEVDLEGAAVELLGALRDERQVVPVDPVGEQGARHFDPKHAVCQGELVGRTEPGVEALAVHLGFEAGKDLFPEIHARSASRCRFAGIAPCEPLLEATLSGLSLIISTGYPQMWKTLDAVSC